MFDDKENDPDNFFDHFYDQIVVKSKQGSPKLSSRVKTEQFQQTSICKSLDKDFAQCEFKKGVIVKNQTNDSKNRLESKLKLVFQKQVYKPERAVSNRSQECKKNSFDSIITKELQQQSKDYMVLKQKFGNLGVKPSFGQVIEIDLSRIHLNSCHVKNKEKSSKSFCENQSVNKTNNSQRQESGLNGLKYLKQNYNVRCHTSINDDVKRNVSLYQKLQWKQQKQKMVSLAQFKKNWK